MSKKLVLSLLLVMLGLASLDAALELAPATEEDGQVRSMDIDGVGAPPKP